VQPPPGLAISSSEADTIRRLAEIAATQRHPTPHDLCRAVTLLVDRLPLRIRQFVTTFREANAEPFVVITGCLLGIANLPPTPSHWKTASGYPDSVLEDMILLMLASLVGSPFAWSTQQDGRLVHNVVPASADARKQLGSSSHVVLQWHIEDAFHPCRGDYLVLLCLRNPTGAATQLGTLPATALTRQQRVCLSQPRFFITPDESHFPSADGTRDQYAAAYSTILQMSHHPEQVSVLFGDLDYPYLRADRCYMTASADDVEAAKALAAFTRAIDDNLYDLVLAPGDLCIIDNRRAVHGRGPFIPSYDGDGRWLKRANVALDISRLHAFGLDPAAQAI